MNRCKDIYSYEGMMKHEHLRIRGGGKRGENGQE
jgi:hypothetical protein